MQPWVSQLLWLLSVPSWVGMVQTLKCDSHPLEQALFPPYSQHPCTISKAQGLPCLRRKCPTSTYWTCVALNSSFMIIIQSLLTLLRNCDTDVPKL